MILLQFTQQRNFQELELNFPTVKNQLTVLTGFWGRFFVAAFGVSSAKIEKQRLKDMYTYILRP